MAQIDIRNATIRIADGGSNYIDIKVGEGDLHYIEKHRSTSSSPAANSTRSARTRSSRSTSP